MEEDEQNEYLEEEKGIPTKVVARFRLGSENRSSKYWKECEEKKCRLCGEEEETLEHIFEKCIWTRGEKKAKEVLKQENPDVKSMLKIVQVRKEMIERHNEQES